MKLNAVTPAYNDEATIGGTIRCLKPFVDRHIVLISEQPYFGEGFFPDKTEKIARRLGAEIVKGNWSLDHFQRSLGNALCEGCDWVLGFDSDEMMTYKDLYKFIQFLAQTGWNAIGVRPKVYWKTTDYRLDPYPTYEPIIAMRPFVRFTHIRNIDRSYGIFKDGTLHHLSWCEPKDVLKKVLHYAHAPEFDGQKWYDKYYRYWQPGMDAVLPTGRYKAVYDPLPEELKKCLSA